MPIQFECLGCEERDGGVRAKCDEQVLMMKP